MDIRKAWKKGYNGVNATNALAKGGIQKEDQRYNGRVPPPANSPPQHVQPDMIPRVGENVAYFNGYPPAGPTSPFASNTASSPPQSPPMNHYTTAPHPIYPPQQARQDYMPGNYASVQSSPPLGGQPYFDQNQYGAPSQFDNNYNGNTGNGAYQSTQPQPIPNRSNTMNYSYDYDQRPETLQRCSTMPPSYGAPMQDHNCVAQRSM